MNFNFFAATSHDLLRQAYFFALTLTKNEEESKDIIQKVLIQMWRKREDIVEGCEKAYLMIGVKNLSLNFIRHTKTSAYMFPLSVLCNDYYDEMKKRRIGEKVEDWEDKDPISDTSKRADVQLIYSELIGYIYRLIESMPPKRSEIFKLGYLEEWKNDEIAEFLNISIYTVKEQKRVALLWLKEQLSGIDFKEYLS